MAGIQLKLNDVVVRHGPRRALKGVSLDVREGELVTLLGPNGAGKSTTLHAIAGLATVTSGSLFFDGQEISRMKPHKRVKAGVILAPQGRGIFKEMTVHENLEMGCYRRKFKSRMERRERVDWINALFPRLAERRGQAAGTLSAGEQQMLTIGRALMAMPKVLLLDEPSLGLAPMMITKIFNMIEEISTAGTTVVLVDQNAQQALSRSDHAYVIEGGMVTRSGSGRDMLAEESVRTAYLGVG